MRDADTPPAHADTPPAAHRDAVDAVAAVAALDEPTRRRLYDHVAGQAAPVSRDDVAEALDLPRSTAAFHLDRLADEGLLDVAYERRTGRSGPGAGRPSKLYRRSVQQIAVSFPERRYEFAGRLLAVAIQEAERTGESPRAVLHHRARTWGRQLGETARAGATAEPEPSDTALTGTLADNEDAVLRALQEHGFEPRADETAIVLANCPFHTLAQEHRELVCGMNLCLLTGLLEGLGSTGLNVRLRPASAHCCVRLEPETRHEAR